MPVVYTHEYAMAQQVGDYISRNIIQDMAQIGHGAPIHFVHKDPPAIHDYEKHLIFSIKRVWSLPDYHDNSQ